jgi:hypothetical protein
MAFISPCEICAWCRLDLRQFLAGLRFLLNSAIPLLFSTASRFISVPPSLGPGYLQNHDSHAIVESIDLYPTLADLSGLVLPSEVRLDAGRMSLTSRAPPT